MGLNKWDRRFTEMAKLVSTWSKDPDNQVGAVLVSSDNRVLSTGFNGLPKGVDTVTKTRQDKLAMTLHAEVNCLIRAQPWPGERTLYVSRFPCSQCAALTIQAGVTRVVCPRPEVLSAWGYSMKVALKLLEVAQVVVIFA